MNFRYSLIALYFLVAGCSTLPEAPGISSETLQQIEDQYGPQARQRVQDWRYLIEREQASSDPVKLSRVNDFFNLLVFEDDDVHWRQADYWATPIEMLATNGGDCEDFSIAKYFTLSELGISEECLRLTYVKALSLNKAHMVLTYQCVREDQPLVLDNLNKQILPAEQREDLIPVYSFNAKGLWIAKQRGMGQQVGGVEKLKPWAELLQKMQR
jgi:predicted transglutaminase-like cysteine proteinase